MTTILFGDGWTCKYCGWLNAIFRKKCRNCGK